jgi:signal peptidase II
MVFYSDWNYCRHCDDLAINSLYSSQTTFCFSIAMILGGAVGNLIYRFTHGAVVDFI